MNQSHHSRMVLTSHLSDAYHAFSSFYIYYFLGAESDDNESDESDDDGIVPSARWNLLPPGTLTRRTYTAT